jgi:hypothetical protein
MVLALTECPSLLAVVGRNDGGPDGTFEVQGRARQFAASLQRMPQMSLSEAAFGQGRSIAIDLRSAALARQAAFRHGNATDMRKL